MAGFQFTVHSGDEIIFQKVYDEELISTAMERYIEDVGGLELGDALIITEVE